MTVRWPGVYGLGMVLSTLGIIWWPQRTREFVLSFLLMLIAGWIALARNNHEDEAEMVREIAREKMQDEPETLLSNGWPSGEDK